MGYGVLVIGDEILSGRRQDRHMAKAVELLAARGERLEWCRIVGDDRARLTATLRETLATGDVVFCFGGIGATPDDLTRECAAAAAGVPLASHPQAVAEIEAQFGRDAYPHRIHMAELPAGCELIPNPYNRVPGFFLQRHYFMPGFPVMAHPMLKWILDTHYPKAMPEDYVEVDIYVHEATESQLLDTMRRLTHEHPEVKLFSLPILGADGSRRIELGLKGRRDDAERVMQELKAELSSLAFRWEPVVRP